MALTYSESEVVVSRSLTELANRNSDYSIESLDEDDESTDPKDSTTASDWIEKPRRGGRHELAWRLNSEAEEATDDVRRERGTGTGTQGDNEIDVDLSLGGDVESSSWLEQTNQFDGLDRLSSSRRVQFQQQPANSSAQTPDSISRRSRQPAERKVSNDASIAKSKGGEIRRQAKSSPWNGVGNDSSELDKGIISAAAAAAEEEEEEEDEEAAPPPPTTTTTTTRNAIGADDDEAENEEDSNAGEEDNEEEEDDEEEEEEAEEEGLGAGEEDNGTSQSESPDAEDIETPRAWPRTNQLSEAKEARREQIRASPNAATRWKLSANSQDPRKSIAIQRRRLKGLKKSRAKSTSKQLQQLQQPKDQDKERESAATKYLQLSEIPKLEMIYSGKIRENERFLEVTPKIRVLNQVEICDVDLRSAPSLDGIENSSRIEQANGDDERGKERKRERDSALPFVVTWIDRIRGEVTIEAIDEHSINCEKRPNYTFQVSVIGCNGLSSNR